MDLFSRSPSTSRVEVEVEIEVVVVAILGGLLEENEEGVIEDVEEGMPTAMDNLRGRSLSFGSQTRS